MEITPFSSKSNIIQTPKQKCPCGADHCYIDTYPVDEDDEFTDPNCTPNNSGDQVSVPAPYVGQTFETDEEALEYYNNFARCNGFLVRRERSKGNPDHPMGVYKRELVCHRAGAPLSAKLGETKRLKRKKPERCRCEAQMVIKKNMSGGSAKWAVVNFSNAHNHDLLEGSFVHCQPPYHHRYISQADRDRIIALAKGGCNVGLIIRALEMEKGIKTGQLTFSERDVKNFLHASETVNPELERVELLKYCKSMKEKNPDFRYEVSIVEDNKLGNIAWSYVESIRSYKAFGDVVIFDVGHRLCTNGRPILTWFGLDNHGNIIFFSCAVLFDKKLESYRWALQAFLRLLDGKHPQTILTDFNVNLKEIIQTDLPETKHAHSFDHIISKLSSWFSAPLGPQYEKFKTEICQLNELNEIEEFEREWERIVLQFGLVLDRHAEFLFLNRFFWGLAYLKNWFFGGLLGGEHNLKIRGFFRRFLNSQTKLKDFIEQVGVAVDFQNQAAEETNQNQNQTNLKTCLPLEEHASTILTPYSFAIFQKEISLSTQYAVYETATETYLVQHHLKTGGGGHIVTCIPSSEEVSCTCKGFEFLGVLCRHALRVLSLKNCFVVPDRYLLLRWRRESNMFPKSSGFKYRSQALKSLGSILVQESAITKDRFDYVQFHLGKLLNHVREMEAGPANVVEDDWLDAGMSFIAEMDVGPTRKIAPRGRPRKQKNTVKVANEENAALL
ncbi:hypothetical protein LUZ61_012787 [Rhynchospora tenuis]|uniref:Protein FAR1-RELATED SEQUENCE n=1 Tax=Rhynchospora tenuis TaxID=198213 RepID=A0AAD6A3J5_9POAL|nr:hypothetical protein LUZ61_012787 [Rhynchospora tenuis]